MKNKIMTMLLVALFSLGMASSVSAQGRYHHHREHHRMHHHHERHHGHYR